jgi:hypothetical protein
MSHFKHFPLYYRIDFNNCRKTCKTARSRFLLSWHLKTRTIAQQQEILTCNTLLALFTNHIVLDVLRIALVQINLYNNKSKAVEHTLKLLKKVGLSDSDIVCLSELWYTKIVKNFEIVVLAIMVSIEEKAFSLILITIIRLILLFQILDLDRRKMIR